MEHKLLGCIVNAPWYIQNTDLHRDLGMETVNEVIKKSAIAQQVRLETHVNEEAVQLLDVDNMTERLKRVKPHELRGGVC